MEAEKEAEGWEDIENQMENTFKLIKSMEF